MSVTTRFVFAAPDDPARTIVRAAAEKLETYYVYPARAHEAAEMLRGRAAAGAYDGLREDTLARRVTDDLGGSIHDQHVRLRFSRDVNPPAAAAGTGLSAGEIAAQARFEKEAGYGLGHVAHLPGNVGYLDIRIFAGTMPQTSTVLDAMVRSVAWSDAVVLDLRRNHGGEPKAVARL
ncbi:MAG: hypothetical protein M3N13_03275, partial [Candidatus Eremiobacteraeota bacterium]|nr:hypothetical protein [Candidatus Eremiobacteraeota bacterium]